MKKWNIVVIDLVPKVSQDLVLAASNSVGFGVAKCGKLCHSLNLISGSRWPKAVAKSCGGHIQSVPHENTRCGGLSSYSLDSSESVIVGKTA